jgi:hypothetical protein
LKSNRMARIIQVPLLTFRCTVRISVESDKKLYLVRDPPLRYSPLYTM